ncbi:MAG TPA: hypothetical protein VMU19_00195 [Bryobacteraceae bacterium]|nr:hypothetical protein [Bryobacteraceae bacterium]
MMRLSTLLFGAALLAGAAGPQTYTGVITDSMCGRDHSAMNMKPDSACVKACVKYGAKYALFDGKDVYILSDQKTPEQFAGQKVKVTGAYDPAAKVLKVTSIAAAK